MQSIAVLFIFFLLNEEILYDHQCSDNIFQEFFTDFFSIRDRELSDEMKSWLFRKLCCG